MPLLKSTESTIVSISASIQRRCARLSQGYALGYAPGAPWALELLGGTWLLNCRCDGLLATGIAGGQGWPPPAMRRRGSAHARAFERSRRAADASRAKQAEAISFGSFAPFAFTTQKE